jgi:hypothetical protein
LRLPAVIARVVFVSRVLFGCIFGYIFLYMCSGWLRRLVVLPNASILAGPSLGGHGLLRVAE